MLTTFRRVLCEIQLNQQNFSIFSPFKLTNQSTLNEAHVTEITKAYVFVFMKARNSLVVRCREERVN